MATRNEILEELKAAGWDGPTSYTKTRLEEMLALVKAGKGDTIERAKRGRPAGTSSADGGESRAPKPDKPRKDEDVPPAAPASRVAQPVG